MGDCAFSHAHLATTHSIFIRSSACPAGGSDIKIKRFSGRSGGNINFRNWRLPPTGWRFLGGIAIWLLFPLHSRFGGATGLLRHMVVRSINGRWDCGMDRPVASLTVYAPRLFIYLLFICLSRYQGRVSFNWFICFSRSWSYYYYSNPNSITCPHCNRI